MRTKDIWGWFSDTAGLDVVIDDASGGGATGVAGVEILSSGDVAATSSIEVSLLLSENTVLKSMPHAAR
jgi:hypothetical protein